MAYLRYHRRAPINIPNLVKVGVVKDQQEFILFVKPLNGMRDTLGEVPNVAVPQLCDLIDAVLVDSGQLDAPVINDTPLSLHAGIWSALFDCGLLEGEIGLLVTYNSVPMKFPDGTFAQMLLRSRDVMALRQVLNDLLSYPTSLEDTSFGV